MTSDIIERGTRIYEERLRPLLKPQHNGEYVVIDVDTGDYELDPDHLAASDRAAAKRPGAHLYATRVGFGALARLRSRSQLTTDHPLHQPHRIHIHQNMLPHRHQRLDGAQPRQTRTMDQSAGRSAGERQLTF